jgi:uncharacterized membrane protein YraQ (UPF0718 family)
MKDDDILFVVIAIVAALLIGFAIGFITEKSSWQQEIVNKGFAEWHLVDGTRETEFKWKEKQ